MKRIAFILSILASLAVGQVAHATTTTYADTNRNWDTWTATANDASDPLGTPSIVSTSVTTNSDVLQSIVFNGTIDSHGNTVFSGDLFINLVTSSGDTSWDYVVRALGTTLDGTAILGLYKINVGLHDTSAYAYSSYGPFNPTNTNTSANTQLRSGLPVGLLATPSQSSLLGLVNYKATATGITFDFTSLANALLVDYNFIIGYAVTCANDVVYQEVPVPEPGTMALLGAGMLCLVVYGKRRMGKSA
jgi:hypothetical protein